MRITAPAEEIRPDLVADDVSGLRVRGYEKLGRVDVPHLWLNDVRDAYLECFSSVDAPAHAFRVTGAKTRDVFLRAEGRLDWKRCLEVMEEVPRNAVVAR